MVKWEKPWSAVTWSSHTCSSSAPQVSHYTGNCSTSFRIHSCFHSRRDLWIRESPSGIHDKHWASEKNTHCYCPGTTDNTKSSLSGEFPHPQAHAAKFYSQSHQNKTRTTHVFDRVILNLYQNIGEQIWGPISSTTDCLCRDYLVMHLKNRKCTGSRASLRCTGLWYGLVVPGHLLLHLPVLYYCSVCFPAKQPDRQIGLALDFKEDPHSKGQMLFLRPTCEHPKRHGRNNSICWLCSLN